MPSAVQLEAFKKLTLIQLIRHGKVKAFLFVSFSSINVGVQQLSPPKYTNGALIKQMKAIAQYAALVKAYPTIKGSITDLLHKEANFFTEVCLHNNQRTTSGGIPAHANCRKGISVSSRSWSSTAPAGHLRAS